MKHWLCLEAVYNRCQLLSLCQVVYLANMYREMLWERSRAPLHKLSACGTTTPSRAFAARLCPQPSSDAFTIWPQHHVAHLGFSSPRWACLPTITAGHFACNARMNGNAVGLYNSSLFANTHEQTIYGCYRRQVCCPYQIIPRSNRQLL